MNLKCNSGKMSFYSRNNFINDLYIYIYIYCLLLYSIFSISFSQEEPIYDFFAFTYDKLVCLRCTVCSVVCPCQLTSYGGHPVMAWLPIRCS